MPVSIPDFWNLMLASRLASPITLSTLQAKFNQVKGAETESNAATLAQWLIAQGALSRYQAKVLLAGQPGPFSYGEYTVFDRVGSGRIQGAFRALHPATRQRVLLWFHFGPVVHNQQWWSVLVDQIALAAQVVHPQVARIYHLCDLGQFKFTAIEDLQGDSADAQLAAGPIHWAVACRMARQAALGLSRMHELKQLHGAIRPQNLWIDKEENIKLLLPPLARSPLAVPSPIDLSSPNLGDEVVRQADYLAPEMGQTGQPPGPWTDIYALGCTLFHLLGGRPPFSGRDVLSKLASHASERIPSLEAASVPAPVSQIVAAMMAKDPARRFQKPRQVADALAQVLEQLDPAQLRWPASPISNKLPEYEAWLQPYRLAPETQQNWAPEIQTPPILAASLRADEPPRGLDLFTDPLLDLAPDKVPPTASDVATSARLRAGADPLRTTPPPARPARSAPQPAAPSPGGLAVQGSTVPAGPMPSASALGVPYADSTSNLPPTLVFPPDEADVIIPFASKDVKQHKRGQQRMLFSAAAVAVFMLILLLLWLSSGKQPQENPAAGGNSTDTSSGMSETNRGVPNPADTNSPNVKSGTDQNDVKPHTQGTSEEIEKRQQNLPAKNLKDSSSSDPVSAPTASSKYRGTEVSFVSTGDLAIPPDSADPADPQATHAEVKATADNGRALWASPTSGSPVSLAHLAPGVQAVLILRPADLMRRADREAIFAALGPAGEAAARELKSFTGASLTEIEQLTIAWIDQMGAGAEPSIAPMYVFRFSNPADREKLKARWGYASAIDEGLVYQTSRGLSIYLPPKENGKVLVVGTEESLQAAAKLDGEPPPVQRAIEKLLRTTDSQRLATLLWMPSAEVSADESPPASGPWQMLLDWTHKFFGDDTRAAALSAHLADDNFFLELWVQGPLGRAPEAVARQFRERLARLPDSIDSYIEAINLQPYGKPVLLRFSQMIKMLGEFTRSGTQGDLTVLRCYLPATAAHNLLMATELALAESADPNRANVGGFGGQHAGPAIPETVAQKLQHVTSLSFARDTLEKAIQMLADDIGVKAEIIGPDLQLEGITKNQSFTLDEKDKPAAEILRVIMLKANPDGKLVYVVKPRQSDGEEIVFITTRAAAAKRGDKLPPELAKARMGKN